MPWNPDELKRFAAAAELRIDSGGARKDVRFAEVAHDNGMRGRIDAAYAAAYPGSPGSVDRINADAARATTLRVEVAA